MTRIMSPRLMVFLLTVAFVFSGCNPLSKGSPESQPKDLAVGEGVVWHLVVIGDSSLWGLGEAFASQIEKNYAVKVELDDYALPSLSAGSVRTVLETGKSSNFQLEKLPEAVKEAEIVIMFVNPMDSINPELPLNLDGCFGVSQPKECSSNSFRNYTADMKAIWGKILELRAGQPTVLRATDIYNPLVQQWNKSGTFDACTQCWKNMSEAARQAAEAYNIPFISRYDAFNGSDHREDPVEKGFIREDGEHPSELADIFTAELLINLGFSVVTPKE
ncbi:MAG: SGNH/GDSL hydrolase family protein [Anaerolineae bacterium]|nr:SGNH/GDSL hydrolase family protein [Anaerolineae bacterium]